MSKRRIMSEEEKNIRKELKYSKMILAGIRELIDRRNRMFKMLLNENYISLDKTSGGINYDTKRI